MLTLTATSRRGAYAKPIDDWEIDLALLHKAYYVHVFHFGWPGTDFVD